EALAIVAKAPVFDAGRIQTGDFFVLYTFTVQGNLEKVNLFLEATDLYRAGNPADRAGPIPLNASRPAEIMADAMDPIGSGRNAYWRGSSGPISGFPSRKTEPLTFLVRQKGPVAQNVFCRIWYSQRAQIKPAGQYSGIVKLTGIVVP
ncbi:MAG TPA: hypothetical protein VLS90_00365, partial [Thermodesulfobacteriota bacterium]|nr:hypothetical protein [Thermodesulfobacteriota bacterium]